MGDRDDEGKYTEQYPDEAFLSAIESVTVASTQNVADNVGCSYDLAYRRLRTLNEQGEISREEVGGSFIWVVE